MSRYLKKISPFFFPVVDTSSMLKVRRSDLISEHYINREVSIPGGKVDRVITITEDMVGFKFGEFCWTRKMNHSDRFKKTKKKKKK
jgi:ribosomal protein S19